MSLVPLTAFPGSIFRYISRECVPYTASPSAAWQVMLLAVSHNRQRQGIGTALLEELLCIGKG